MFPVQTLSAEGIDLPAHDPRASHHGAMVPGRGSEEDRSSANLEWSADPTPSAASRMLSGRRRVLFARGVVYAVAAIGLCIAASTTAAAQPGGARTNTVLLSPSAMEKMDTLISLRPGRSAKDVAATGSMQPVLDENYIVIVEQRRFEDLAFGDIVIFRGDWLNGLPVAHRLIGRQPGGRGWQTKGDHCRVVDPQSLTPDKYKGCVVVAAVHKVTGEVKQFVKGKAAAARVDHTIAAQRRLI